MSSRTSASVKGVMTSGMTSAQGAARATNSRPLALGVMAKMREIPVNDFYVKGGKLRDDGRLLHDMYFVQVKTPAKSSGPWEYYKIVPRIPGDQAFRPAGEDAVTHRPIREQAEHGDDHTGPVSVPTILC
jgi:hypothetical protein